MAALTAVQSLQGSSSSFAFSVGVLADPILRSLRRQLLGQRGDMLDPGADLRLRQLAVGGRRFGALQGGRPDTGG